MAHVRVQADVVWICRSIFGNRMRIGPTGPDGRVEVELRGHGARALAAEVAGLGPWVEVRGPPDVREDLAAVGAERAALYRGTPLLIHEAVVVAAPPEAVWGAIERPAEWWPYLELDATPGGRFEERWEGTVTSGDVLEVDPPRLLRLSWKDEGWPATTEVELRLQPAAEGTLVTVRHTGWAALADAEQLVAAHRAGWRVHLDDLARVASRP